MEGHSLSPWIQYLGVTFFPSRSILHAALIQLILLPPLAFVFRGGTGLKICRLGLYTASGETASRTRALFRGLTNALAMASMIGFSFIAMAFVSVALIHYTNILSAYSSPLFFCLPIFLSPLFGLSVAFAQALLFERSIAERITGTFVAPLQVNAENNSEKSDTAITPDPPPLPDSLR